MKKKTTVEEIFDTIKDNPAKIIKWAEKEIKEYENLIKILKDRQK